MLMENKKVWIIHAPAENSRTIWEDKLWGIPDKGPNRERWKQIKEGDKILFVQKDRNDYKVFGEGVAESIEECREPNPSWNEKDGLKSQYPLRVHFKEVKKVTPRPIPIREVLPSDFSLPEHFSIIELPSSSERGPLSVDSNLALSLAKMTVWALEGRVFPFPTEFLTIFSPQNPDDFEDAVVWLLRVLGFKVSQRGHKEQGGEIYDFEIEGENIPIIGDAKFSDRYQPDTSERRKIMDYIRQYSAGRKRVKFVLVVKGEADTNIEKLRKEASEEGVILASISYTRDLLPLLKVLLNEGTEKARKCFLSLLNK
jgi:hypothetical protein